MKSLEDIAFMESVPDWKRSPIIGEALDPSRMVAWYNRMEQELQKRLDAEEGAGGNKQSAQRLRTILNTWTDPKFKVTSSLNIEAFDGLAAALAQYAKNDFDWKHHAFCSSLYNSLTQAVSKLEQSGMVGNDQPEEQPDFSGGAPGGDFGPTDDAPSGPPDEENPTPDDQGPPDAGAPDNEEDPEAPPAPGGI